MQVGTIQAWYMKWNMRYRIKHDTFTTFSELITKLKKLNDAKKKPVKIVTIYDNPPANFFNT